MLLWALAGCADGARPAFTPSTPAPSSPASVDSVPAPASTLPPEQTPVVPGRYRWTDFSPAFEIEIGPGWAVGHRHLGFFDLWSGSSLPAIGFARFSGVRGAGEAAVDATSVADVLAALGTNARIRIADRGPVEVAGLVGRAIDIEVEAPQTPVFTAEDGDFNLDPGLDTRWNMLDVPGGGVLFVYVVATDAGLTAALGRVGLLLDTMRLTG
jgi:hypothetical protein